jgi:hypothetical protein
MADVLRMDHINGLPQPFMVRFCGDKDWSHVIDIGVDVPIVRIDVYGLVDHRQFAEVMEIRDAFGNLHDPDDWYAEE